MTLSVMSEIPDVKTASLGGCLHGSETRARWAEGFHDELNGHVFDPERDGIRQLVLCPRLTMRMTRPYRIGRHPGQQGLRLPTHTRTEVSSTLLVHQRRIRGRDNITISTWTTRTLRRAFLLCKETGMQKWARMLLKTGKAFVDPSAMMTQMREDSDF